MSIVDWAVTAAALALVVAETLRWLRVAQREHYLPWSVSRVSLRWLRSGSIGPSLRGRTSRLAWTRRLRTLAVVVALVEATLILVLVLLDEPLWFATLTVALTVAVPIDLALLITKPVEYRLVTKFVDRAAKRLRDIHPTVVAITGSYGKTSTKVSVAHLLAGTTPTYASPASFNNRAGLARAINEGLTPGTAVFVAEMGTYGRGEIAELCSWCPPAIAVITAIGPVHLERFKTEEAIVAAKSEIMATAHTVVLNVDDERLAALAVRTTDKQVVRVSATDKTADVAVVDGTVFVKGVDVGRVGDLNAAPTNAACAVAVALELGVAPRDAAARLATAPVAAHRLEAATAPSGVVVLDDTFNSNPAGARRALAALARAGAPNGTKVVVTPGMIELGGRQAAENESFARAAAAIASTIVIVGETNRRALAKGAKAGGATVLCVRTRERAVEWVRANLGPGDAVLYENDLPDHYR